MKRRRSRELAIAIGLALAAHAGLFSAMLWRTTERTAEDRSLMVELLPFPPEARRPEPPPKEPEPPTAAAAEAPSLRMTPAEIPSAAPPLQAAPQARTSEPVPARPGTDTDALARTVIPFLGIDCRWPGLSAAERSRCIRAPGAAGSDDRFRPPPGKAERMPRYAMDRDKETGFDAIVDSRVPPELRDPENSRVTAFSRCDGWASDTAQRNLGGGCFPTSQKEGGGATRPKSKYAQPRGRPFEPMRRD